MMTVGDLYVVQNVTLVRKQTRINMINEEHTWDLLTQALTVACETAIWPAPTQLPQCVTSS